MASNRGSLTSAHVACTICDGASSVTPRRAEDAPRGWSRRSRAGPALLVSARFERKAGRHYDCLKSSTIPRRCLPPAKSTAWKASSPSDAAILIARDGGTTAMEAPRRRPQAVAPASPDARAVGDSQPLASGPKECPGAGGGLRRGWTERLGGKPLGRESTTRNQGSPDLITRRMRSGSSPSCGKNAHSWQRGGRHRR